jgi:hypothetical protein
MKRRNLFKAVAGALAALPILKVAEAEPVEAATVSVVFPYVDGCTNTYTTYTSTTMTPRPILYADGRASACWEPNYLTDAGVCLVNPGKDIWTRDFWYWQQQRDDYVLRSLRTME